MKLKVTIDILGHLTAVTVDKVKHERGLTTLCNGKGQMTFPHQCVLSVEPAGEAWKRSQAAVKANATRKARRAA